MSKKKLYFKFSNGEDLSNVILQWYGVKAFIDADEESRKKADIPKTYTIVPVWLTDKEFNELPEAKF